VTLSARDKKLARIIKVWFYLLRHPRSQIILKIMFILYEIKKKKKKKKKRSIVVIKKNHPNFENPTGKRCETTILSGHLFCDITMHQTSQPNLAHECNDIPVGRYRLCARAANCFPTSSRGRWPCSNYL
jgi:hypothetical protein